MDGVESTLYNDALDVQILMLDIDSWALASIRRSISALLTLGLAFVMLFMLLLIKYRKQFIHWVHVATVVMLMVRSALDLAYITGPLATIELGLFGIVSFDWSKVYGVLAAATVANTLVMMLVEVAVVYQAWAILGFHRKRWSGCTVLVASITLALVFSGLALANCGVVINSAYKQYNSQKFENMSVDTDVPEWLLNVPRILFTASIGCGLLLLVGKLVLAIRTRRVIGMKQFDHLHVLVIMGTQTMLIPTIILIVNHAFYNLVDRVLVQVGLLLTVLLLPLSAMWALAQQEHLQGLWQDTQLADTILDTDDVVYIAEQNVTRARDVKEGLCLRSS